MLTWLITPPVEPRPKASADGTLQHFDRLDVEEVAVVLADVAHAVEEEIAARGEAAQPEDLRRGHAAFRRGERDAGHVAQRFLQRRDRLLPDHRLRDDVHELRDVAQRRLIHADAVDVDSVLNPLSWRAGDLDFGQRMRLLPD